MKTSELIGAALDLAVAKCEGVPYVHGDTDYAPDGRTYKRGTGQNTGPHYSGRWADGGPIIEKGKIRVLPPVVRRIGKEQHAFPVNEWRALIQQDENENAIHGKGPTPLVAAMRCYVSSKLGDEVEVPDELAWMA